MDAADTSLPPGHPSLPSETRVGSPEESPSDRELVARTAAGALDAFETLIARYQQAVFNIAYYKSRNCFDAEDLTQDVFLAAFKALPSLKDPENFAGWLFGIAYNRCHKWFQRERTKVVKFQEICRRAEQRDRLARRTASSGGGHSERPELAEFLERLPADVRQALTLKYLEGKSYEEISGEMGIKPHRIDYLIRKGKRMIRERVKLDHRAPPPEESLEG
jgi:RNA polymerase sigma-70 factor (ECF subfamily)